MTTRANSRTPSLAEGIRAAIETRLQSLHTALPGRIESYNAATQTANIKPMVKRRVATSDGRELLESLPVISDVPIMFPRCGQFFVTLPLAAGDFVLLVFCERSIDNYAAGTPGLEADPDDFRMHDLTDAVAFPGFFPTGSALPGASTERLVVGHTSGAQLTVAADGTITVNSASGLVHLGADSGADFIARADKVNARLDFIETWANAINGQFNNHKHNIPDGETEPVDSSMFFPALPPLLTVACDKVKGT